MLPPYLQEIPVWETMLSEIDRVYKNADDATVALKHLREVLKSDSEGYVTARNEGRLVRQDELDHDDTSTLIQTCSNLGFAYPFTELFSPSDFVRVLTHLGEYYLQDKGTVRWQNYLAFVLNSDFKVITTWTKDYVNFLEEGDPLIGLTVDRGGDWYPTTHVYLEYGADLFSPEDWAKAVKFFFAFANINLVLLAAVVKLSATMQLNVSGHAYIQIEI